jgi:hypothetical protein
MQLSGANWTGIPVDSICVDQPRGGWELESAHFVAARAGLLLQRVRASLNDSSTAG